MKQTIRQVLDGMKDSQINMSSESARETISTLITAALKTKGHYRPFPKDDSEIEDQQARESWVCNICGKNTYDVENDYIGQGTNHLGCELKSESKETEVKHFADGFHEGRWEDDKSTFPGIDAIQKQVYNEMTSDGLPEGGDTQAVLESHKLAEEIVENRGEYIYESPDGGKTIFRRPVGSYDSKDKVEIDWETKEPTGRKFSDYNNGHWEKDDEG